MTINDGGAAFPTQIDNYANYGTQGMTLRDHFAGLAMRRFIDFGMLSDDTYFICAAKRAYVMADLMLKAREAE
jgi:hypothetical protein